MQMPDDWKNEELKRIKYFELYAKLKSKKYDANIPLLEKLCNDLMCAATQPTAGQRKGDETKGSVYWSEELDLLPWHIAIEACALVLSGKLEELKK
jgi:hypothetical protein